MHDYRELEARIKIIDTVRVGSMISVLNQSRSLREVFAEKPVYKSKVYRKMSQVLGLV